MLPLFALQQDVVLVRRRGLSPGKWHKGQLHYFRTANCRYIDIISGWVGILTTRGALKISICTHISYICKYNTVEEKESGWHFFVSQFCFVSGSKGGLAHKAMRLLSLASRCWWILIYVVEYCTGQGWAVTTQNISAGQQKANIYRSI